MESNQHVEASEATVSQNSSKSSDDDLSLEMILAQVDSTGEPDYMQIESLDGEEALDLMDPEVWIGDTGATTHSTAHLQYRINPCKAAESDNILGVWGPPAGAKTIMDILLVMMNCAGQCQLVIMQDITYIPEARYNLFIITKLMKARWKLQGEWMRESH